MEAGKKRGVSPLKLSQNRTYGSRIRRFTKLKFVFYTHVFLGKATIE